MGEPGAAFVLLRHDTRDGVHWDLMLDTGSVLATWQLAADPSAAGPGPQEISARRLPDHRYDYLDYEGPISRNRGYVTRSDRGTYRILEDNSRSYVVILSGERLSGRFRLQADGPSGESWRFTRLD
ncbi:MAG TPA: DNA polymerase ligase N-terminal domain-containing protein [Phycisphaerae bacterium]|nr:DNA polymerase ligase N-terminal domain-containing protein [Phycisphaerae bacterium]HRR85400.1 DNA polymerase ligase N-terminal domain-containing protein [Phycisphaerae bacterium]